MCWVDNLKIKCMVFLIVLTIISAFFSFNINVCALDVIETTSGGFPGISEEYDSFVIVSRSDGSTRLFTWNSSNSVYVYNHTAPALYFSDNSIQSNTKSKDVDVYNLSGDKWVYYKTTYDSSWIYEKIIATTVDIQPIADAVSYDSGYGLKNKVLDLKKNGSYSYLDNNMGSLKYLDLYFDKSDFQKEIDFSLIFNDNNSYDSCGFDCDLASVTGFDIAYLIKDENNMYKWVKNNQIGVSLDIDELPPNNGNGFILNSKIILKFDETVYSNVEQVKVSINLNSAFNFSYEYYDNSSITENNIDDYYSNMLGTNGRLYRNKQYEKYSVISTKESLIKDTILVEYINTDYHLYLEYFDTNLGSYIDSSMLVTSDYFLIKNRDFEKYQYKIGTSIEKGLYLMNYLYHNNNKNVDSYYWFYISLDVEYYNTNYLDESYYYDNTGEIDQNIIQNPNSETDNIKFSDTFRPFFSLVDDLEATRILFNDSFKIIYYSLPRMITLCLELLCHAICVVVLLQMLGWGDY